MPNTKTKKFDFQIFLAVFLMLLAIFCTTVCIVLDSNQFCVARALDVTLPDNGIVGDNLLSNSCFNNTGSNNTYSGSVPNFIDGWNLAYGSVTWDSNGFLSHTNSSGNWQGIYFDFVNALAGHTYTFTVRGFSTTSQWGIYCYDYPLSGNRVELGSKTDKTTAVSNLSVTFTVPANFGKIKLFVYGQSAHGNFTLQWSKLEDGSSFTGYVPDYQNQITELQNQVNALQNEINRLNGIIESKDKTIDYYETLLPNTEIVSVFDISKCVPSTFVYNGVTYSSDTIKPIDGGGWNVYDSRYNNKELPPNKSVGFSLLLTETLNNTKIKITADIQPWYSYSYDGGSNLVQLAGFSVGYRNQNGQIVKLGDVTLNLGGMKNEFIINQPTNEIVFFAPENNRLEVGKGMGVSYYKVNTQVLYDEAYAEGYKTGYGYGKYIGKNEGIEQASDYSFFSLFSAVFDAPITAIVGRWGDSDGDGVYEREGGMLNFYIPGLDINFAPFLLSIFTLAIIVMIIRFILARKS